MLLALKFKMILLAAAGFASPLAISALLPTDQQGIAQSGDRPALIELAPGSVRYRAAGDFTRAGKPAEAPLTTIRIARPLTIMKHQVSSADYQRCVTEGACRGLSTDAVVANDRPAVQVSWRDTDAYAAWLTRRTGETYRLPTDEEWAYAAGSRYQDDGLPVDENDPSRRWLARYEREANLRAADVDSEPRPFGAFGTNEYGLLDVGGNVWEWTNTCFVRTALDAAGKPAATPTANCGVRVVEGQHRSYVSDFIRDARAGGCAAGIPPANLGFRLVRDQASWQWQGIADLFSKPLGRFFMNRA
jgi:formylglycine-generating enzyme required for sulfatase activity